MALFRVIEEENKINFNLSKDLLLRIDIYHMNPWEDSWYSLRQILDRVDLRCQAVDCHRTEI